MKEIKTFEFTDLKFKRKSDGKVIEFGKKQIQIEIEQQGSTGKGEKEIILEKDGKEYRLTVKIELYIGLWRDIKKAISFHEPPSVDYEYFHGFDSRQTAEKPEGEVYLVEEPRLLHPWKTGRLIGMGVFVLVVIGIVGFVLWWKKRK
ncbi:PepSY domain-containing protein [endosymbiont GvMRE of Glomus versiforme]|uniref:PepSY domain-containing protein n=1 Tax=endosymbiont GvMRE of Glomus versiforme TaxID=2039283 RepID=UPI000EE19DB9|nr:PepSY domain-containing protein [endosymbiont GvMRE of Glomus versiforme]RHZ36044.1 hypothetical protein GvMRE_Ic3g39 [endosymbiont GvMRE of Glomus versiforme]